MWWTQWVLWIWWSADMVHVVEGSKWSRKSITLPMF